MNNKTGEISVMEKNCIEINGISKIFTDKEVLKNISITIPKGELFGLLGPSGAGKTTLIRILTGQLRASGGSATIFDEDCGNIRRETYKKMGLVLDNSGLYERLSCYDNLLLYARLYGVSKDKIIPILERVGLLTARKTNVSKLSKGMRQRLVLARAILPKPELLFLDEPTSGLDPATSLRIHELLFELQREGTTIFLTTHNMEEAYKLCNHIALLNEGEVAAYGEPEELCRKYNTQNSINIRLKSGEVVNIENTMENTEKIMSYFKEGMVETIHSSEPNLETVFIELTGRGLI